MTKTVRKETKTIKVIRLVTRLVKEGWKYTKKYSKSFYKGAKRDIPKLIKWSKENLTLRDIILGGGVLLIILSYFGVI